MLTQDIVIIFIRVFIINARSTKFIQVANISGNFLEYNNTINKIYLCIPPGVFGFLQLLSASDSRLQINSNMLKY
jgi:hypothetical protein